MHVWWRHHSSVRSQSLTLHRLQRAPQGRAGTLGRQSAWLAGWLTVWGGERPATTNNAHVRLPWSMYPPPASCHLVPPKPLPRIAKQRSASCVLCVLRSKHHMRPCPPALALTHTLTIVRHTHRHTRLHEIQASSRSSSQGRNRRQTQSGQADQRFPAWRTWPTAS